MVLSCVSFHMEILPQVWIFKVTRTYKNFSPWNFHEFFYLSWREGGAGEEGGKREARKESLREDKGRENGEGGGKGGGSSILDKGLWLRMPSLEEWVMLNSYSFTSLLGGGKGGGGSSILDKGLRLRMPSLVLSRNQFIHFHFTAWWGGLRGVTQ